MAQRHVEEHRKHLLLEELRIESERQEDGGQEASAGELLFELLGEDRARHFSHGYLKLLRNCAQGIEKVRMDPVRRQLVPGRQVSASSTNLTCSLPSRISTHGAALPRIAITSRF